MVEIKAKCLTGANKIFLLTNYDYKRRFKKYPEWLFDEKTKIKFNI